jgi:hypothetical protein
MVASAARAEINRSDLCKRIRSCSIISVPGSAVTKRASGVSSGILVHEDYRCANRCACRLRVLDESGLALLQILHFRLDDVVLDGVHQTAYPRRTSIGEMFEHGKPFDQTAEQALRRLVSRAQSASVIGVWPRSSGGSSRIGGPITAAESRAGSSRPSTPLGRPGAWTAGIGAWGRPCE